MAVIKPVANYAGELSVIQTGDTIDPAFGGTGLSSYALGDLLYSSAANTLAKLAGNTTSTKKVLTQTGTGTVSAAPAWSTLTGSDVGLGNVENTALSTWAGSTSITTLGTIASGTWNGSVIADTYLPTTLAGKTFTSLTQWNFNTEALRLGASGAAMSHIAHDTNGWWGTNTYYSGGWQVDDAASPAFVIMQHIANDRWEFRHTAAGGAQTTAATLTGAGVFNAIGGLQVNGTSVRDTGILTSGTLGVGRGGTGLSTYTSNGLLYASGASTLAQLAVVNNAVLSTNGSGAPSLSTTLPSGLSAPDLRMSTAAAVTATGTSQGTGTALTSDYNVVTSVSSGSVVVLPTAAAGKIVIIVNKGANPLLVYPATGGQIDAQGTNASITVPVGGWVEFNASSATQWYSTFNATVNASAINGSIALTSLATVANATILGNNTGSASAPIALTAAQTKSVLALNNVENTALSTWAGSSNITTLGTIGQTLVISRVGAAADANLAIAADSGNFKYVRFRTGASVRWDVGGNNVAETGSNVGTDFYIHRFDDTGAFLSKPFAIERSTGNISLSTIVAGTWNGSVIGPAYLGTGTRDGTKFLRDDGAWIAVSGGGSSTLAALTDVGITSVANNNLLRYNSTTSKWENVALTTLSGYGITDAVTTNTTQASITGAKTFTGGLATNTTLSIGASNAATVGIELGNSSGTATTPFIDFHSGATATDYDGRIIVNGGDGTAGNGTMRLIAANLYAGASGTNSLWHSGNLTPSDYLPLAGGTMTGAAPISFPNNVTMMQMAGGGKLVAGAAGYSVIVRPGANDATVAGVLALAVQGYDATVRFSVPDGLSNAAVIANTSLTVGGNTVWHAGNLTPSNYLPLAGGTMTGQILYGAMTASPITINGALTGNGRIISMINTDTGTANLVQINLKSGATANGSLYTIGNEYATAAIAGRTIIENVAGNGTMISNYSTGDTIFANGTARATVAKISATGDIYGYGIAYYGDDKNCIQYSDAWLRLNQAGDFTSGVYTPSLFRTDTAVQVGTSTTAGFYTSTTVAPQWQGIELGYRGIPYAAKTAAYTFVAADADKGAYKNTTTAITFTLPVSVFAVGDVIPFGNFNATGNLTIAGATNVTLRLAGTTTTGNRTVAPWGMGSATCIVGGATPTFLVAGAGVT